MPGPGRNPTAIWSCRRAIWLSALLMCLCPESRPGFAADDGTLFASSDAAGAMPVAVMRLPAVESAFGASPATYTDQGSDDPGLGSISPATDDMESLDAEVPDYGELQPFPSWFDEARVGYEGGFVIASERPLDLQGADLPYFLRVNGLLQMRQTRFDSAGPSDDLNQLQLIRGRLALSGHALTPDLDYFIQLDGRSSAGDEFRLLDYIMDFDFGHNLWGLDRGTLVFKAGKYKVPFTLARYLSAREFEFCDRSVASMYFDVNRSLAWGLHGQTRFVPFPADWEMAVFNGLVTGGAETGSSGRLDNNFAYSARVFAYPTGDWGTGALADLDWHESPATRIGAAFAGSTIDREGPTEFNSIRVVDSGIQLSTLLPPAIDQYDVHLYCLDASCKYRGWSITSEYYLRSISGFEGAPVPLLFDHGFWFQVGKFVVPGKLELISRWSRVVGDSGTLGVEDQSADEIAAGIVWYFRGQNAKLTFDATHLDGAPISASSLDILPGDIGWLFRTQLQLAF